MDHSHCSPCPLLMYPVLAAILENIADSLLPKHIKSTLPSVEIQNRAEHLFAAFRVHRPVGWHQCFHLPRCFPHNYHISQPAFSDTSQSCRCLLVVTFALEHLLILCFAMAAFEDWIVVGRYSAMLSSTSLRETDLPLL